MRNVKTGIWIFVVFLVQTVILEKIHIYNASLSIVLPYIICVMLLEENFRMAAIIGGACSLIWGVFCGHEFVVATLYVFYLSLVIFALRRKPVYVHNIFKAVVWSFAAAGVMEIMFYLIEMRTLTADALIYSALPAAILNGAAVPVIYPLLKRTMYKEENKKLLIGDLV